MLVKLKSLARSERLFTVVLLCLIGVISFVLGRYSVIEPSFTPQPTDNQAGVVFIDSPNEPLNANATPVVVSKNGTKYHLLTCSGASTIKEENKVYFDSIDQAKAAGYSPAANCEF